MALISSGAVSFKLAAEPTMVTAANVVIPVSTSAVSFKLAAEATMVTMVTAAEIIIPISTSAVSFIPAASGGASGGGSSTPVDPQNWSNY
jgi:hypothetical protein